jgi:hypothetical protein
MDRRIWQWQNNSGEFSVSHSLCHIGCTEAKKYNKLRGLSPQANYSGRATSACRRS